MSQRESEFSEKGIIPWEIFKNKYSLTDWEHFKWVQLIDRCSAKGVARYNK